MEDTWTTKATNLVSEPSLQGNNQRARPHCDAWLISQLRLSPQIIIDAHGRRVSIVRFKGKGTRLTFHLKK